MEPENNTNKNRMVVIVMNKSLLTNSCSFVVFRRNEQGSVKACKLPGYSVRKERSFPPSEKEGKTYNGSQVITIGLCYFTLILHIMRPSLGRHLNSSGAHANSLSWEGSIGSIAMNKHSLK